MTIEGGIDMGKVIEKVKLRSLFDSTNPGSPEMPMVNAFLVWLRLRRLRTSQILKPIFEQKRKQRFFKQKIELDSEWIFSATYIPQKVLEKKSNASVAGKGLVTGALLPEDTKGSAHVQERNSDLNLRVDKCRWFAGSPSSAFDMLFG